jgi:hypothetical protein
VPIYELGETLIALQRIVHKAYLYTEGEYQPGRKLAPLDRKALALCIGGHKKGSDVYEIYQFLTDPDGLDVAKQLIPMALAGIGAYIAQKILSKKQQEPQLNIFIQSIHKEVTVIADRVGNVGDIERVEISSPVAKDKTPIAIDAETRDYIRSLYGKAHFGDITKISGVLTKLLTRRLEIELEVGPRERVRVSLEEELFRKIRYSRVGDHITLKAQPVIRFAEGGRRLRQYEAVKILDIKPEGDWDQ